MTGAVDTSNLYEKVAFAKLLGLRRELAEGGVSRLVLDTRAELCNNFENTHGGVIMTMLDMAMSSAALSKADFKKAVITVDMSTHFLSPGKGQLTAHGRASGGGKSICFCEAHIEDEVGRTVARAMGAFKYVDPR
ncbi:MAG: PaaI family thioesterase [Limnohabitans sp.]|nr:MAG: PaaI family thioesterase [Limnohabitans sp.]